MFFFICNGTTPKGNKSSQVWFVACPELEGRLHANRAIWRTILQVDCSCYGLAPLVKRQTRGEKHAPCFLNCCPVATFSKQVLLWRIRRSCVMNDASISKESIEQVIDKLSAVVSDYQFERTPRWSFSLMEKEEKCLKGSRLTRHRVVFGVPVYYL